MNLDIQRLALALEIILLPGCILHLATDFLKNGGHGFGNIEADRSWLIADQAA